ncbi:MAG: J domain-containing protein, partial [bacterium]
GGSAFGGDFGDLGDIFSDLFGGARTSSRERQRRGNDLALDIEISLEEAFLGIEREIDVYKTVVCPGCAGKGGEPGSKIEQCPTCKGTGSVTQTRRTGFFSFSRTEVCPTCRGHGQKPSQPCSKCGGDGVVKESKRVGIKIPPGIENGQIIKLSGQGEAAPFGGQAGDLYVTVHIKPHPHFKRRGNDLYYDLVIHMTQAALGDKIEIPTLEGPIELKIPAGVDSGEVIRLRGKGTPIFGGRGKGDLMVRVKVKTPKKLSRKAKKLLEELKEEL